MDKQNILTADDISRMKQIWLDHAIMKIVIAESPGVTPKRIAKSYDFILTSECIYIKNLWYDLFIRHGICRQEPQYAYMTPCDMMQADYSNYEHGIGNFMIDAARCIRSAK